MKLILSLCLIWVLSSTGGALQCQDSQTDSVRECAASEYCAAAAAWGSSGRRQSRSCVSPSFCNQTVSFNFGCHNLTAFVQCCKTNNCNQYNATDPEPQASNGLTCFACDADRSAACNETVRCEGVQDRCSSGSVAVGNKMKKAYGCVSKNLCEAASDLKALSFLDSYLNFTSAPKCCEANLCNSARTVRLHAAAALMGLSVLMVR